MEAHQNLNRNQNNQNGNQNPNGYGGPLGAGFHGIQVDPNNLPQLQGNLTLNLAGIRPGHGFDGSHWSALSD